MWSRSPPTADPSTLEGLCSGVSKPIAVTESSFKGVVFHVDVALTFFWRQCGIGGGRSGGPWKRSPRLENNHVFPRYYRTILQVSDINILNQKHICEFNLCQISFRTLIFEAEKHIVWISRQYLLRVTFQRIWFQIFQRLSNVLYMNTHFLCKEDQRCQTTWKEENAQRSKPKTHF